MNTQVNHAAYGDQSHLGRGMGRVFAGDPRDCDHLMSKELRLIGYDPSIRKRLWKRGPTLNQGSRPHCVGFGCKQLLLTGPIENYTDIDPSWIYFEAQKVDEWPGENYDGTSVRAGAKILQREGYLSEYKWAFDVETTVLWVLNISPVVFGTTWYVGMMDTDQHGFIHPTGSVVGGHAYLVDGADRDYACPDGSIGAFDLHNSWGEINFGIKGTAKLSFKEAAPLIADYGEVCTAYEKEKNPVSPEPPEPKPPEPQPPSDIRGRMLKAGRDLQTHYEKQSQDKKLSEYKRMKARLKGYGVKDAVDVMESVK